MNSPPSLDLIHGEIVSVKRFAVHDGPGIRTTVFFKGCPLSCTWCHNPECRDTDQMIWFNPGVCIRCLACCEVCACRGEEEPHKAPDGIPVQCVGCGRCVAVCPSGARQRITRAYTPDELVAEVLRDEPFYAQSGGGVTFSGGEPTAQPDFLLACLELCRACGIRTALDTCGHVSEQLLIRLVPLLDLILFDIKLIDEGRHRRYTGVSNRLILENLRMLDTMSAPLWLRVPLVPGVNDAHEDLEEIGRFVVGLKNSNRLHLLPYHSMGSAKRLRVTTADDHGPFERPSKESVAAAAGLLSDHDLDVHIGG